MKKLFTSFISLMTIGTFGQCGFKKDNTNSQSSTGDKQKSETKEKQTETSASSSSSSGSSSVKSSIRNQYLKKSHEEWIADSISKMTSQLKDNSKYKDAFNEWKTTNNGFKARVEAYSKSSDNFKQELANWQQSKINKRNSAEFLAQVIKNKNTGSYKIYKTWTEGVSARWTLQRIYHKSPAFRASYNEMLREINNRISEEDYVSSDASDNVFDKWIQSQDGKTALKPLFEADTSSFGKSVNMWTLAQSDVLKKLWYSTTTGQNNFKTSVDKWNGEGDTISYLGENHIFAQLQIPLPKGSPKKYIVPKEIVKTWLDTNAAIDYFKTLLEDWFGGSIEPNFTRAKLREQLKNLNPIIVAREAGKNPETISEDNISFFLRQAFQNALKPNHKAHTPEIALAYYNWKKEKYKDSENSIQHNKDLYLWIQDRKTTLASNDNSDFSREITAINPNKVAYKASDSFEFDVVAWAKDKKAHTTNTQNVKEAFINVMKEVRPTSNGNAKLKNEYVAWKEHWETLTEDKYQSRYMSQVEYDGDRLQGKYSPYYVEDFIEFIHNPQGSNEIQSEVKKIIETKPTRSSWHKSLYYAFIAWQPTNKENFVKSETVNSQFNAWSSNLGEIDLTILNEISQILKDKDLFTKTDGNSEFVKVLKEITQDSYDSYLLSL